MKKPMPFEFILICSIIGVSTNIFLLDARVERSIRELDASTKNNLMQALQVNKESISRQNNKVLSYTVTVQDRMSRLEQLVAECEIQVISMNGRLGDIEEIAKVSLENTDKTPKKVR